MWVIVFSLDRFRDIVMMLDKVAVGVGIVIYLVFVTIYSVMSE